MVPLGGSSGKTSSVPSHHASDSLSFRNNCFPFVFVHASLFQSLQGIGELGIASSLCVLVMHTRDAIPYWTTKNGTIRSKPWWCMLIKTSLSLNLYNKAELLFKHEHKGKLSWPACTYGVCAPVPFKSAHTADFQSERTFQLPLVGSCGLPCNNYTAIHQCMRA